jgi:hypothetical protein
MPKKVIIDQKGFDYLFERLKNYFLSKDEFEDFRFQLEETLKNHRDDLLKTMDKILKEIITSRQEQKLLSHRSSNHGERLEKLENIHPTYQHPHDL